MIETITRNYLKNKITESPIYLELPQDPPVTYVLVEKTSSYPDQFLLWHSTINVKCYAGSMVKAAKLCNEINDLFKDMIELSEISDVELNTTYNNTDTQKREYCYQSVFDITHY